MITLVELVRLSLGTAIEIGLESGNKTPNFTTAFLMTYREEGCEANCAFCPQAQDSTSASDRLSRISWPEFELTEIIENWPPPGQFRRICIQTICFPEVVNEVVEIVRALRKVSKLPISVAIHPIPTEDMQRLKDVGVTNIGIALDASTETIFDEIKGETRGSMYRWEKHKQSLLDAQTIFGGGYVTTHLIIGLGETEKEATDFIFDMNDAGISVGLFAFTNIKGTSLENHPQPDLSMYRRIQVVRHLIAKGQLNRDQVNEAIDNRIILDVSPDILREALSSGVAFQVTGCKGCNRPFYNERPRGPMYNYPRPLNDEEKLRAIEDTKLVT